MTAIGSSRANTGDHDRGREAELGGGTSELLFKA